MNKTSNLFLEERKNEHVHVKLQDGSVILGILIEWDAFTIGMLVASTDVLVFKHAIVSIH